MRKIPYPLLCILLALLLSAGDALAQRRGGGHLAARGGARASVNARPHVAARASTGTRPGANGGGVQRNFDANRNRDVNRNVNRDININRDIDVNHHGGWYDDYDGCCHHPIATAAAVTAAAVTTAAVIGSVANTLPLGCTTMVVNGIAYEQCGSAWYAPQFVGTDTTYVVVAPPT